MYGFIMSEVPHILIFMQWVIVLFHFEGTKWKELKTGLNFENLFIFSIWGSVFRNIYATKYFENKGIRKV